MRRSPRVVIHRNRTVTITGLSYADFDSIVTAAILHTFDELRKEKGGDSLVYNERRRKICNLLKPDRKWVGPYRDIPVIKLRKHEVAQRRGDVIQDRANRLATERAIAWAMEQMA